MGGAHFRHVIRLCIAALVAVLIGCSRNTDLGEGPLLPVSGRITYDGKPLAEGELAFYPDKTKGNVSRHVPRGVVGADGTFTISTTTQPGAVAGWYQVTVVATRDGTPPPGAEKAMEAGTPWPVSIIPMRYSDPTKSQLSIEVVPAPNAGAYDLVLTK